MFKFGTLEGLVTALFDEWTFLKKKREIYIAVLFFICFLIGLTNVTEVKAVLLAKLDTRWINSSLKLY